MQTLLEALMKNLNEDNEIEPSDKHYYGEEDVEIVEPKSTAIKKTDPQKDEVTAAVLQQMFGVDDEMAKNAVQNAKQPEMRDQINNTTIQVLVAKFGMNHEEAAAFVAEYGDADTETTLMAVASLMQNRNPRLAGRNNNPRLGAGNA